MWYFRRVNRGSLSKDRYLFKQRTEETEGMMNAVFGKREKVQGSWCEDVLWLFVELRECQGDGRGEGGGGGHSEMQVRRGIAIRRRDVGFYFKHD